MSIRHGYKYQLREDFSIETNVPIPSPISSDFITMDEDGKLTLKNGYAWDGASGPCPDFRSVMRGSLVHDALYQLIREKFLPEKPYRTQANQLLYILFLEDGMFRPLAFTIYTFVKLFGNPYLDPASDKQLTTAPEL